MNDILISSTPRNDNDSKSVTVDVMDSRALNMPHEDTSSRHECGIDYLGCNLPSKLPGLNLHLHPDRRRAR